MDIDSYLEWQSGVIEECVRVVGSRGSICWQVGDYISRGEVFPLDTLMYHAFKSRGLQLRNRIVWHYEHGLHCTRRLSGRYETINWWSKTDDYVWHLDPIRVPSKEPGKRHYKGPKKGQVSSNPLGKNPSDVWIIPNVKSNHPEKTIHPCQFPVGLAERLVLPVRPMGRPVYDPLLPSGRHRSRPPLSGRSLPLS